MAYVHFKIMNAGFDAKFGCKVDGYRSIDFRNGEYVKIDSGKHLITFDGGGTDWNIQETVSDDDCIDVEIMISYNDSCGYMTVVGMPEYRIIPLNQDMIDDIEERIKDYAEARSENAKKIWKKVLRIASIAFVFLSIAVLPDVSIFEKPLGLIALGVMGVIGLVGSFFIKTK